MRSVLTVDPAKLRMTSMILSGRNTGYSHTLGVHGQFDETQKEQHHTVRQKIKGIDNGCVVHRSERLVGHADKNCCENKAVADNREIEKERNTGL